MSKKYLHRGSALAGPMTPPQSPKSAASPSLSPESLAKVNDWVDRQPLRFSSEFTKKTEDDEKTVIQDSASDVSSELKKVHWTPNIQDNEGKTTRKPIASKGRSEDKTLVLSSKKHRRPKKLLVPDPSKSRDPPPAPRPRRLPTPDLPNLKCEDFCDCCYDAPMSKMNAQLASAMAHIASTKQLPRRLT